MQYSLLVAAIGMAGAHPMLPEMWTAFVNEIAVGKVYESQNFIDTNKATSANPSACWTNFTDGSCKRLIYSNGTDPIWSINKRYLFGCGQDDQDGQQGCCHEHDEGQDGGPIEYQIPDVHPAWLAPVKSLGKQNITKFDGSTVETDVWQWTDLVLLVDTAYTTDAGNGMGTLHRWVPKTMGKEYPNEYVNFTGVKEEDAAAFKATFYRPENCHTKCSSLHEAGKLSKEAMNFLKAGKKRRSSPPTNVVV